MYAKHCTKLNSS